MIRVNWNYTEIASPNAATPGGRAVQREEGVLIKNMTIAAAMLLTAGLASNAEAADPGSSAGTWKLNLKESIPPQGRTFHQYTVVVKEIDDASLEFEYTNTDDKGQPLTFGYKGVTDGVVRDMPGNMNMRGAMVRLPAGTIKAQLWMADGSYEEKFCQLDVGMQKNICLATVTAADGSVVFFKQVLDRQ